MSSLASKVPQAIILPEVSTLISSIGDHYAGYGYGHGHTTISWIHGLTPRAALTRSTVDQHYETIRQLRARNHKLTDKHKFYIVSDETAVTKVYQPVQRDLTAWGTSEEQQWIVIAIFQELNIATGELLFESFSLAHVTSDGKNLSTETNTLHCTHTNIPQKPSSPSTPAKPAPATTPPTPGTTSTSTTWTRIPPANT